MSYDHSYAQIAHALDTIKANYGDNVSVAQKSKSQNQFGRNLDVATDFETVGGFQGTEINETYVSTNIIDSIVSSSTSDTTQTITIEGCTIDTSGNLTFVSQNAALNGRTEVPLTTPLARVNKAFIAASGTFDSPYAALVGDVSIYDNTDGIALGIPNTAAATKCRIRAGEVQSEKCATATEQTEYWILTDASVAIGDTAGNAAFVTCQIEMRDIANGGPWRQIGKDFTLWADTPGIDRHFEPFVVVPKNHDIRLRAKSDANVAQVYAEISGYLAKVI